MHSLPTEGPAISSFMVFSLTVDASFFSFVNEEIVKKKKSRSKTDDRKTDKTRLIS